MTNDAVPICLYFAPFGLNSQVVYVAWFRKVAPSGLLPRPTKLESAIQYDGRGALLTVGTLVKNTWRGAISPNPREIHPFPD